MTGPDKRESISLLHEYEPLLYFHSVGDVTYIKQTFPGNREKRLSLSYTTCRFLCGIPIIHLQCERYVQTETDAEKGL